MRKFFEKGLIAMFVVSAFAACKNDDSCKVSFPVAGAFVSDWGESTTVRFNAVNVKHIGVTSVTGGWKAEVDLASKTIVVTAPESADAEGADKKTNITLTAASPKGASAGAVLVAYLVDNTINLSGDGGHSNCYIAAVPNVKYKFDTTVKAETDEALATADVGILWQSSSALIQYLNLDDDGFANFYIGFGEDEDGEATSEAPDGNAVIAAYDSAGNIIWSWHIWTAAKDPRTENVATYSNGLTFMGRNLGAYANSDESEKTEDIWKAYGLYYQWGRKDPFLRPRYYDCARSMSETVYDADKNAVYISSEASDAEKGTVSYTIAHPDVFLTANAEDGGDWLYGAGDNSLWGTDGAKTEYDPCPKGWRVPSKDAFAVLDIAETEDNMDLDKAKKIFGWNLTDKGSSAKYFYLGGGYKSYFNGLLSNLNYKDEYPYTPVPWVGYYWTDGVGSMLPSKGIAMFFDLNTSRAVVNAFDPHSEQYRANAMQVRCVKE